MMIEQEYLREELLSLLRKQFASYEFDIRTENSEEKLFILSSGRKDFKTTITLDFPLNQEQVDSIIGVLEGTIQILKFHDVI